MRHSSSKRTTASSSKWKLKEAPLPDRWKSWKTRVGSIWLDGWREATYMGEAKRQHRDVDLCKMTGNWWLSMGQHEGGEPHHTQADIYMKIADCSIELIRERLVPHPWVDSGTIRPIVKQNPDDHLSPVNYTFQSTSGCCFTIGYSKHESHRKAQMEGVSHAWIQFHKGAQRLIESENRNTAINLLLNLCGFYAHTDAGVGDTQTLPPHRPVRIPVPPENSNYCESRGQSSTEPVMTSSLPIEVPVSSSSEAALQLSCHRRNDAPQEPQEPGNRRVSSSKSSCAEIPQVSPPERQMPPGVPTCTLTNNNAGTLTFSNGPVSSPERSSSPPRLALPSVPANECAAIESIPDNVSVESIRRRVASELVHLDMVTAETNAIMESSHVDLFAS